jgi:spore germination protein KB
MGACKGIAKLLKLNSERQVIVPVGLLMLMLSFNVFENIMHLNEWVDPLRFFNIPFQLALPIITWITAEIKTKMQQKSTLIKNQ